MSDNEVRISTNQIKAFINQDPNDKDKTVLYLKGNHLDAVPLSETKLFDRVLAWFGFGPLSLKNISKFIQDYHVVDDIPELRERFALKLIEKYQHYNKSHKMTKVSRVAIDELSKASALQFADASTTVSGRKQDYVLDFAYSNANTGTAYIVDVKKSSSSRAEIERTLAYLRKDYETSMSQKHFSSIDQASAWFEKTMPLTQLLENADFDFTWVQKVNINGEFFLFTCQKGTTSSFIKYSDGKVERTHIQTTTEPSFFTDPIDPMDVIVGISDGFGDYISANEIIEELRKVDLQANHIFGNLITKIVKQTGSSDTEIPSASGKDVTVHKGATHKGDNVALFVLR